MTPTLFDASPSGSSSGWYTAHCDGGSRGNPGPSGYGAVVEGPDGRTVARLNEFLGIQTNNYAEYSGLLAVLRWAIANNARQVRVVSDSELMVKQLQGKYKVSSPAIRPLYDEAKKMVRQLESFEIRHTLRAGNKEADQLANEAMDRGMGKPSSAGSAGKSSAPSAPGTLRAPAARPYGKLETTGPAQIRPATPDQPRQQILEGYVKNGVVHLLSGELPDGIFVKIVRE